MTDSSHQRRDLLFYLDQDVDYEWRARMTVFVALLSDIREWRLGPPTLVDEIEDDEGGDAPIETLGGVLKSLSELPPHALASQISEQQLDEVETLVRAVEEFSSQTQSVFAFQLGDTDVGRIENGVIDKSLQRGLLDEWRNRLAATK